MSGDIPEMREEAFSEDLIVRYLLGDLPEEAQVEIEDRAFQDQQYLQSMVAVENDLIDEYARGELSDSERRRFEQRFLASEERRRKVEFARALASVTSELPSLKKESLAPRARAPLSWTGALAAFLRGLNPAARFALAAAALLILIGGPWLFIESQRLRSELAREQQSREQEQQALQQQLAEERARSEEAAARLERDEQRERSQEPARQMEPSPEESTTRTAPPAVVSLALSPGISRGGGARPKLLLPQATGRARLQIGIEPEDQYSRFSVELRAQGGQRVWAEDNLRARDVRGGRTVVLYLPGNILRDGQYELTLKGVTGEGAVEEIGYYYFDVLKK
jgi:hypothetical protein